VCHTSIFKHCTKVVTTNWHFQKSLFRSRESVETLHSFLGLSLFLATKNCIFTPQLGTAHAHIRACALISDTSECSDWLLKKKKKKFLEFFIRESDFFSRKRARESRKSADSSAVWLSFVTFHRSLCQNFRHFKTFPQLCPNSQHYKTSGNDIWTFPTIPDCVRTLMTAYGFHVVERTISQFLVVTSLQSDKNFFPKSS
jgi:hypothetical protein